MDLFVVTKLSTIFDIFTSEDDAVNSFFPSRPLRYPHIMREGAASPPLSKETRSRLTVFLCHSSTDKVAVREIRRLLSVGARPWLDEMDLLPGQIWEREIPAAVQSSDAVVVCLSSMSIGKTGYLQREIKFALDAAELQSDDSIFLIPSRLEPCEVPERLRRWQWVNLFDADGYDRLVTALQARALGLGRVPLQIQPNSPNESGQRLEKGRMDKSPLFSAWRTILSTATRGPALVSRPDLGSQSYGSFGPASPHGSTVPAIWRAVLP